MTVRPLFSIALVLGILLLIFTLGVRTNVKIQPASPEALKINDRQATLVSHRLVVQFKSGVNQATRDQVLAGVNGHALGHISQLNLTVFTLPDKANDQAVIHALENRPDVNFVEQDQAVPLALIPTDPGYSNQWHLPKIGAPLAWDNTTGSSSVTIAIIDTGVDCTHPDLAPNCVVGWNVLDNSANSSDVIGHGTHVAGLVAAVLNNAVGVSGVCSGCKIMPIRASNDSGTASTFDLANALVWAADHGARIANLSFCLLGNSPTLNTGAQYFRSHGGVVVTATSNSGFVTTLPDNPDLFQISATTASDAFATWSGSGPPIDLSAPGENIYSTGLSGGYSTGTGTSDSSPIVSGAAGLIWSVNPNLTNQQVESILKQSADDLGLAGWDPQFGWGRLNAARAVAMAASSAPPETTPPTISFSQPVNGANLSGTVAGSAVASDGSGIGYLLFSLDNNSSLSDALPPYTFNLFTAGMTVGVHGLTAFASDNAGNTAKTNITFNVLSADPGDTTLPTTSITAPASGTTVSGGLYLSATAADNNRAAKIEFYSDTTPLGSCVLTSFNGFSSNCDFWWNTAAVANGIHTLTTKAYDQNKNVGVSAPITVTVNNPIAPDTTPPTTAITAPMGGTVSGLITIQATASDNVGVTRVEFYNDGTLITDCNTTATTCSWNTATVTNASHMLQTRAYDAAGNLGFSPGVAVTVNNAPPPPPTITVNPVTNISNKSATINWMTNINTTGLVRYGLKTTSLTTTVTDPVTATTTHHLILPNLSANKTYYYQITATAGTQTVSTPTPTPLNFKTPR